MLITPITPKVMASPMAASSSTEPSERPYQAFCTIDHIARLLWIEEIAPVTAFATSGGWSAPRLVSSAIASWSPSALMTAMASSLSTSEASGLNSRIAARASVSAALASLLVSFASASSTVDSAASSCDLNTDCAAAMRFPGSGDISVRLPIAASTERRRRLLSRTSVAPSGNLSTAAPVAASTILSSACLIKTFLLSGSANSRSSCSALMMGKASGFPDAATASMASAVSEKSSLANLATASSNAPAKAGAAKATISSNEKAAARRRSRTCADTGLPRQEMWRRRRCRRPLRCRDYFAGAFQLRLSGSGALTAALVGLGVVVTALLADPVADQVLGALELLRPGVAGDEARGLPHHVELAVGLDLADEHRLGDMVVGQHLRGAAGQVLGFDARESVDHLVRIGRLHLLDRLHPHVESDDVRFHRIVGHALRILGVGLPGLDELLVLRRLDRLEVVFGGVVDV